MSSRARRALAVVAVLLATPGTAAAADFTVTKGSDTRDGTCNADCSLREAVDAANVAAGFDRILLPAGTYTLSRDDPPGSSDNVNDLGDLDSTGAFELVGAGPGSTIVDAGGIDRHLDLSSLGATAATYFLSSVTLRDGDAGVFSGGAIRLQNFSLTLTDVVLSGNEARSAGALDVGSSSGSVVATIRGSTLQGNTATGGSGGAIRSDDVGNALGVETSALVGNRAEGTGGHGGAIDSDKGSLSLENVTLSGNTAGGDGGAVRQTASSATLTHTTIAQNSATGAGDGLRAASSANVETRNVLFSNGGSNDCALAGSFPISSSGNDLDAGTSCGFLGAADRSNADARLVPLAANPGTIPGAGPTHALYAGSAAIDAAAPSRCVMADQRGITRPIGPACDIGAFEAPLDPPAQPAPATEPTSPAGGGDGASGAGGVGTGGGADVLPPNLSPLVLRANPFAALRAGGSIARRRRAPLGTAVAYRLSEAATVRFTVERARRGRRVGTACRRPTRRNRARRRCARYVAQRGSFNHQGRAGANKFRFSGRLGRRGLRPGRYRLVAVPIDTAGNRGAPERRRFRIVERPGRRP